MGETQNQSSLAALFHNEMLDIYTKALKRYGYNATRFLQLVQERGGLQAARVLLQGDELPSGLIKLYELGELDISMEALILKHPWCTLFSQQDLRVARQRLAELGYRPCQ